MSRSDLFIAAPRLLIFQIKCVDFSQKWNKAVMKHKNDTQEGHLGCTSGTEVTTKLLKYHHARNSEERFKNPTSCHNVEELKQ